MLSFWRSSCSNRNRLRNIGVQLSLNKKHLHDQWKPVIAIRREDNVVWERRAPLAPSHVRKLVQEGYRVIVQPANKRAFPVQEYVSSGAEVNEDLNEASVILGVKQVPIDSLLPSKTYVFFSHTIKAQSENMAMLDAILEKNIRLIDYEKMEQTNGLRVVAFGQYAGYAGMINILHGIGLRLLAIGHHTPLMHIGIAHNYRTSGQAFQAVRDAGYEISLGRMPESIGPLTFVFTGTGNVSQGAQEVFRELPYVYVEPHELKNVAQHGDPSVVYGCVVDMHHHLRRVSDGGFDMQEYFNQPQLYESVFAKEIAPYASCIMNGIFWRPNDPRLLTTSDAEALQQPIHSPKISPLVRRSSLNSPGCPRLPHRLIAISDVSADPGGSLEFMTDCTSIDAPFDIYDASKVEARHGQGQVHQSTVKGPGILMCSVDNLPAQLPREATQFFGDQLFPYLKDIASNRADIPLEDHDKMSPVVQTAIIASNGKLTPKYEYIQEMRRKRAIEGAMSQTSTENHKVLVLGAGYVSYPVIDYITKHNDTAVTVVSALKSEVDKLIGIYKRASPIILDVTNEQERLEELVKGHDLVISLLPYTLHPNVAKLCIDNKKNLVTASYASEAMRTFNEKALDAGISIVMEVGLDPGIDHMLAMECFKDIKDRGGEITSFVSWCGGLPAPEAADNPLRYKFSWSPVGVLMVTLAPSKYLMNGEFVEMREGGENYREGLLPISFMPGFNLEGLPNRDSTFYKNEYGLDQAHTILRGTLRYKGFRDAVVALQDLGLVSLESCEILSNSPPSSLTWKEYIAKLLNADEKISRENLTQLVCEAVGGDSTKVQAIEGLGLLSDSVVDTSSPNSMTALAKQLSKTLAYESDERDMIIMRHEIEASFSNGKKETHHVDLVEYGNPDSYSAMAKTVGYPCAIAARMLLLGKVQDKGIITPLKEHIYAPLLKELGKLGIKSKTKVIRKV